MKNQYAVVYWYPNESHLFSKPHFHFCETEQEYNNSLKIAERSGYEVICSGSLEVMHCVLAAAGMLKEV